jgi:hypothetical protein
MIFLKKDHAFLFLGENTITCGLNYTLQKTNQNNYYNREMLANTHLLCDKNYCKKNFTNMQKTIALFKGYFHWAVFCYPQKLWKDH